MRRLIALLVCLLLLRAATTLAQETIVDGSRKIVSRAAPIYPELARKMGLEGMVRMQVMVTADGSVQSVQTIGGNPVLAKAAEDCVYKFRWAPAPEASKVLVEMKFHRP